MKHPFKPVYDDNSRVLILGTFPSKGSVDGGGYYGHPRNMFWQIMAAFLQEPGLIQHGPVSSGLWAWRYEVLRRNLIALWDVIASCERDGNHEDSQLRNVTSNRIERLLTSHPNIRAIVLNGTVAGKLFMQIVMPDIPDYYRIFFCPSTSPASRVPYDKRVTAWRGALGAALKGIDVEEALA